MAAGDRIRNLFGRGPRGVALDDADALDPSGRKWEMVVHLNNGKTYEVALDLALGAVLDRARKISREGVEWSDADGWYCYPAHMILRVAVRAED